MDECGAAKVARMKKIYSSLSKVLLGFVFGLCFYAVKLQSQYLEGLHGTKANEHVMEPPSQRHDSSSKFTIMRSCIKRRRHQNTQNRASSWIRSPLAHTTISDCWKRKSRTWASHKSIRHYFAATEMDDADPSCYKTLNKTTIDKIVNLCTKEQPYAKGGMRIQYKKFSKGSPGWICAQQRFAIALETLGKFYRRELLVDGFQLPDFLLMQDDDTYYNMVRIEDFLRDKEPSIPLAEAPCLIRHTLLQNFSFPWGGKFLISLRITCVIDELIVRPPSSGYGFILSRGAVWNLIRPVYCNDTSLDDFERNVCARLDADLLGERQYFTNGMSVSDLMGAQVRNNLFTKFSRENWAYCKRTDFGHRATSLSCTSH